MDTLPAGSVQNAILSWERTSEAPTRVLAVDGKLAPRYAPSLTPEGALDAYRWMLVSRAFDEKGIALQRQGRMGTFAPCTGQEAATIGAVLALDPKRDWLVPQYREIVALVRHGYPMERALRYFMGDLVGARIPDDVKVLPIQISLAAQIPHAVGLAWGLALQKLDGVVLVSFGDGSSSEGDFHEACNFAGTFRAPVIFLLQNNEWAISTPRRSQSAAASFACRAEGYGFPGVLVDGNDIFAMHDAASAAVARARRGDGPTLIEASTYRLFAHNTSDDHRRYANLEEHERRAEEDPIRRLRAWLLAEGHLLEDDDRKWRDEAVAIIEAAVRRAEAGRAASPEDLFSEVYGATFARFDRQRSSRAQHGTDV